MSIYKIAKLTGFSPSTVARALSNKGYCSEETRKKIMKVVEEINYSPNLVAKELRKKVSKRIIFGIPDIANPYYFKMIQGINDALENKDYHLMLFHTKKSLSKELEMINLLNQRYCDGIILVSFDFCEENISAIRNTNRPVVILNRYDKQRPDDNFDYVYNGHTEAMAMATEHLVERGCRNIVLLTGDPKEQTSMERNQGYISILNKYNLPVREEMMLNGNYAKEAAYDAFMEFERKNIKFDGIVASNDLMALGVLKAAQELKIKIPKDVKLVSLDNTDFATLIKPTLSSVDLHEYELGNKAGQLLLERLNSRKTVSNYILTPTLYIRQSSQI